LNQIKKIILLYVLLIFSCSSSSFFLYDLDGNKLDNKYKNRNHTYKDHNDIKLYFDSNSIEKKYSDLVIISTNNYYYGEFFFDDVFMNLLRKKAESIGADALIYNKDFKGFSNISTDYIHFTAIIYEE
tara:strand:- start:837 stop:1220 length:384 start_codon:yes stop_codon:yes gene_type:complete